MPIIDRYHRLPYLLHRNMIRLQRVRGSSMIFLPPMFLYYSSTNTIIVFHSRATSILLFQLISFSLQTHIIDFTRDFHSFSFFFHSFESSFSTTGYRGFRIAADFLIRCIFYRIYTCCCFVGAKGSQPMCFESVVQLVRVWLSNYVCWTQRRRRKEICVKQQQKMTWKRF